MERWRNFFGSVETDICTIIENAIAVAASDCPQELRARRDRIAQRLFSCGFVRCGECSALTLAGPDSFSEGDNIKGAVLLPRCEGQKNHAKSCRDDGSPSSSNEVERNRASNYSYDEAEALTEEMEEESQIIREVDRIKGILLNPDESEKQLYDSLRRLELMQLSVDTLQVTAIGKVVSGLKKHHSEQVCSMAKMLVSGWKELVDIWMKTAGSLTAAALGASPDSVCPEDIKDDENGLPSPPLDEGAFLTTQTASIEMSEFFAGMDDDGNPRIINEIDSDRDDKDIWGYNRKQIDDRDTDSAVDERYDRQQTDDHDTDSADDQRYNRKQIDDHDSNSTDDEKQHYDRKQSVKQNYKKREGDAIAKQSASARNKEKGNITSGGNKEKGIIKSHFQKQKNINCHRNSMNTSTHAVGSSVPVRKSSGTPKPNEHRDRVHRLTNLAKNQMRPSSAQPQHKPQPSHNLSVSMRVEAAKRKLHEGYQQADKAKKQRTVQLMEIQDIPKTGRNFIKPLQAKLGSHNRQRFGSCR